MLKALLNPFAIVILLTSLALVGLALSVLDRGPGPAIWILLIGLTAYAASTAVIYLQSSEDAQFSGSGVGVREEIKEPLLDSEPDFLLEPESGLDPNSARETGSTYDWRLTQTALQRINRLPALSQCDLITLLPGTLSSNSVEPGQEWSQINQTPLEKGRVLREVLIAGIEKLRPPGETTRASADPALGYHILREFYVEDKPVAYLLTRYSIAEATYHRHRREAISAVSRDLEAHETLLSRSRINS